MPRTLCRWNVLWVSQWPLLGPRYSLYCREARFFVRVKKSRLIGEDNMETTGKSEEKHREGQTNYQYIFKNHENIFEYMPMMGIRPATKVTSVQTKNTAAKNV